MQCQSNLLNQDATIPAVCCVVDCVIGLADAVRPINAPAKVLPVYCTTGNHCSDGVVRFAQKRVLNLLKTSNGGRLLNVNVCSLTGVSDVQEIMQFAENWTVSPWDIILGDDEFGRVALASSPKARVIWDAITAIRASTQSSAATSSLLPKKRSLLQLPSTSTCVRVVKPSMCMVALPPAKKPRPSASSDGA